MKLSERLMNHSVDSTLRVISPFLGPLERRLIAKADDSPLDALSPVFIVGAPRTGSTILYQALTNAYRLIYIDNTACRWHRNLRFGMWLSHRSHGEAPHNNFTAHHGDTTRFGGHAPSECGRFWYRWLPKDRHFVDHHEVTGQMVEELRDEILGISAYFNAPLLFKNLNAGQRLRLISRAFPQSKILFIRRDPRFVVRSIMKARVRAGATSHEWWSVMPPNFLELLQLPEPQMCTAQVYHLESQIEMDLALFHADHVREIHYQDLSGSLLEDIARWLGITRKSGAVIPDFHKDSMNGLAGEEISRLNDLVGQFPFKKDLFI